MSKSVEEILEEFTRSEGKKVAKSLDGCLSTGNAITGKYGESTLSRKRSVCIRVEVLISFFEHVKERGSGITPKELDCILKELAKL